MVFLNFKIFLKINQIPKFFSKIFLKLKKKFSKIIVKWVLKLPYDGNNFNKKKSLIEIMVKNIEILLMKLLLIRG